MTNNFRLNSSRIGFQGEAGSYSETALVFNFQTLDIPLFLLDRSVNCLKALKILPLIWQLFLLENSTEGSINETYDLLVEKPLFVVGEIYQKIHHCLIINKNSKVDDVSVVYSHPQALAQCRRYIQSKPFEVIPMYDTAGSVKFIKENLKNFAAAID